MAFVHLRDHLFFFHPDLVAVPCIAPLFALLITVSLEPPSPWLKKAVSLFLPENDQNRMETESCFLKPERETDLSLGISAEYFCQILCIYTWNPNDPCFD